MRKNNNYLLLVILLLSTFHLFAQNVKPIINSTLSGKVIDSKTNEAILGASVQIKGTTHGVQTDVEGKFYFQTGQKFPYTLIISYIGYDRKEIIVETSTIEILLNQESKKLDEVIVVGYGSQRKKDITGAIASVPKETLSQIVSSADNLLRGTVPGVSVTQSSGQPGAISTVRVRGGNSITGGNEPLYVIDGTIVYNDNSNGTTGVSLAGAGVNVLSTLNPADIESIEVLKDASATAIYGSRGANGVILVTTKKGTRGTNTVSYQTYYGIQRITKKLDLLDGADWAILRNDIQTSIGQSPSFSVAQIEELRKSGGSDWQSAAFKDAPIQNHQLTFSGGDEQSRYAISTNYFNQQGIAKGSDFERLSARINYEKNITDLFKFGINSAISNSTFNGISGNTSSISLNSPNTISSISLIAPIVQIKNIDGSYNITNNPYVATTNGYIQNPINDLENITNQTKINRALTSLFGEYKLLKDFTVKTTLNNDIINTKQNYYAPSFTTNGLESKGLANVGNRLVNSLLNENTLSYNKYFNKYNQLSAIVGYTYQYTKGEVSVAGANNFINDINKYNSLQDGVPIKPSSDAYESVLRSWIARLNYSLSGRYNFTLSARADGSSRFGLNNRWGYFPSVGFSWNISDEPFAQKISRNNNDIKLRLSFGTTGNQEIGNYLSLASLGSVNYALGGTINTGFAPTRLSNAGLKWEKTSQFNIGVDVSLNNRVNFVFDTYYKKTTDLLVNVPIPLTSGYTSVLENIGAVENKGIEVGLNTVNLKNSNFSWNSSLVFSRNKNRVLEIGNGVQSFFPDIPSGVLQLQQPIIVKVGEALGTFWGYKTNGLFQNAEEISSQATLNGIANTKLGDRKYVDINGDGKITAAGDKVNLGNAQPKIIANLNNTFAYKGIELFASFQAVYGNKIFNALKQQLEIPTLGSNGLATLANHWTPTNTSTDVPRAANSPATVVSDRYIEDGSFLRLKTITLGYTIPKYLSSRIFAKNLKVYFSAQNLITWTKYSGYDPEISSYGQSNLLPGVDYGAYPNTKNYTLGLNINF